MLVENGAYDDAQQRRVQGMSKLVSLDGGGDRLELSGGDGTGENCRRDGSSRTLVCRSIGEDGAECHPRRLPHDEQASSSDGTPCLRRERRPQRVKSSKAVSEPATSVEPSPRDDSRHADDDGPGAGPSAETRATICEALDEHLGVLLQLDDRSTTDRVRCALKRLRRDATAGGEGESGHALRHALRVLYQAMDASMEDGCVQDRAIYLIGKLAREADWVPGVVADTGGIGRIVQSMIGHQGSHVVQERAIATLLHLTTTDRARTAIVDAKGAESVCWAMREFVSVKSIQVQGSTALCNMAFGSALSKKRIGKIGGVDGVVKAMDSHPSDPDLQSRCCLALRNLTCGSRVNQWIAGRACAMEAILRAMASFPDDVSVQYQGCVALANLCRDEPDNRCRAAECGVIEATLRAMRSNARHPGLAEHSLALLRNLSVGHAANQARIGGGFGVAAVVSCLGEHIRNPNVVEMGCEVLRHLLFVRENRLAIYECGGLEVIVRVMREGAQSRAVAEASIYALGNSVYDLPDSKSAVGRCGGMSALVDMMSQHIDCPKIQEHGCRALRNLADSDDLSARLLAESGAIDSCIFACSGYPENARIQEHAIAMLFNMTYSEDNVRRMRGLDAERVLLQACERHAANTAVLSQATAVLSEIGLSTDRPFPSSTSDSQSSGSRLGKSAFNLGALARKGSLLAEMRSRPRQGRLSAADVSRPADASPARPGTDRGSPRRRGSGAAFPPLR
jgi:hypothetical protein